MIPPLIRNVAPNAVLEVTFLRISLHSNSFCIRSEDQIYIPRALVRIQNNGTSCPYLIRWKILYCIHGMILMPMIMMMMMMVTVVVMMMMLTRVNQWLSCVQQNLLVHHSGRGGGYLRVDRHSWLPPLPCPHAVGRGRNLGESGGGDRDLLWQLAKSVPGRHLPGGFGEWWRVSYFIRKCYCLTLFPGGSRGIWMRWEELVLLETITTLFLANTWVVNSIFDHIYAGFPLRGRCIHELPCHLSHPLFLLGLWVGVEQSFVLFWTYPIQMIEFAS